MVVFAYQSNHATADLTPKCFPKDFASDVHRNQQAKDTVPALRLVRNNLTPIMSLAFESYGRGIPILFIHGWELSGTYEATEWEPMFYRLDPNLKRYRRIYIDLPGMGNSLADETTIDLQSMLDRVVAFIDAHISPAKFLLVGTSLGGYLARALATKFGDQVRGMLLKVPLIEPDNERRDVDIASPIVRNEEAIAAIPASQLPDLGGQVLIQTPAYISKLLSKFAIANASMIKNNNAVLEAIRNDPKRYSLPLLESGGEVKFDKPALILTGRHDDVVGYRDAMRLLEVYTRANFVVLDRGTHFLPVDEEGLVEGLVGDWLRRVEEVELAS
jgi:pimeloyl-ACP methyl ester carboxylesterase